MREAFEQFVTEFFVGLDLSRREDGCYKIEAVQAMWVEWQSI